MSNPHKSEPKEEPTPAVAAPDKEKLVWAMCDNCNGSRRHRVLEEVLNQSPYGLEYAAYQIVECVGCESTRFRLETFDPDSMHYDQEPTSTTYPDVARRSRKASRDLVKLDTVGDIYLETSIAIERDCRILAAAGLRACVEAVCKHEKIDGKDLSVKIDGLKEKKLLTAGQADLLHAARYIGNRSLHEIVSPEASDLNITMEIVESLLQTTYVFPGKAKEIAERYSQIKKGS